MANQSNIIYPPTSTSNPSFARHDSLLTVGDLKTRYLHGVSIKDNFGNDLPESAYQSYIFTAISNFEHEFGVTINPTTFEEEHDYNINEYQNYGFMQLRWKPIISVEFVKVQYIKNNTLLQYPDDWLRIYREPAQIHITPTSGAISSFSLDGSGFLPQIFGIKRRYPQLFLVKYTAGFEDNKIPWLINRYIGLKAAIDALNIAGDLILGAGIASQSLSIDGLSQSIGSTSSATNAGYGARIIQYLKEIESITPVIRNFYTGLNFRVC